MSWSASVLTTASSDTEPTIVVTFANAKYIFNAGENTNRAFLQSRNNWRKTKGVFLTSVKTQRTSGLAGLLMGLADGGIPRVELIGPPGLTHVLAAMRFHVLRYSMAAVPKEVDSTQEQTEFGPKPVYKDENITVFAATITPSEDPTIATGSKRKRSPSSEHSAKRTSLGVSSSLRDSPPPIAELPTLQREMLRPGFSPQSLTGRLAQEWRELMVQNMLRASLASPLKPYTQQPGGKGRGKSNPAQRPTPSRHYAATRNQPAPRASGPPTDRPIGFTGQLPKYGTAQTSPPSLAYIVVGPRVRGKFDVSKATALGLPDGRIRRRLTDGETVTFTVDDGNGGQIEKTVRPEECMGPSDSPGAALILDTPTTSYIPSLISSFRDSDFFSRFHLNQSAAQKDHTVRTVFHICGPNVLADVRYLDFMNGFGSNVHHIVSSRQHMPDPITFTSAAFNQLRLNQLDPAIFPIPSYRLTPAADIKDIPNLPENTSLMRSHVTVDVRPAKPPVLDPRVTELDRFHPSVTSDTPLLLPEATQAAFIEAKQKVQAFSNVPVGDLGANVVVLPLGTGSAVPSKYRNVSSTLIMLPEGNLLLDAGEGTWGQLSRHFGTDISNDSNVWELLRNLRCIFISHIHGDHHIGLAKVLAMRKTMVPPPVHPLYLVASRAVHVYLRELSDVEDLGIDHETGVRTILSEALLWTSPEVYHTGGPGSIGGREPWLDMRSSKRSAEEMCQLLGLQSFQTVDVLHRCRCYGCVIKHISGFSIVYSGDTMPSENLINAGQGTTLLIHEATMADDQAQLANAKAHSTFGQAVQVGRSMNARHVLLTHFSARYPKMPSGMFANPITTSPDGVEPVLALAFDHASMRCQDMWKMQFYISAIEKSISDTKEEGDDEHDAAILTSA